MNGGVWVVVRQTFSVSLLLRVKNRMAARLGCCSGINVDLSRVYLVGSAPEEGIFAPVCLTPRVGCAANVSVPSAKARHVWHVVAPLLARLSACVVPFFHLYFDGTSLFLESL